MKTKKDNKSLPKTQNATEEKIDVGEQNNDPSGDIVINEEPSELAEGDDPIEMDINNGQKIDYSFSPPDGELEDESEDKGDLPEGIKKTGNRYDPALSVAPKVQQKEEDLEKEGIYITDSDTIGLGYGDNDYAKEEEEL